MKKVIYFFIFFFCLFIGIDNVGAVPKTVLSCTYNIYNDNNPVLEIYKDSETSLLTTSWVNKGTSDFITFGDISVSDATSCPTLYYIQREIAQVATNSVAGTKASNCSGKCSQTEVVGVKSEISSTSQTDVDDVTNKTLMLTCSYNEGILLKIYDDKTYTMTGQEQCVINKTVLDRLECPELGHADSNYVCYYNLEDDSTHRNDSLIELIDSSNTGSYKDVYGEYFDTMKGEKYSDLVCKIRPFFYNAKLTSENYSSGLETSSGNQLIDFSHCSGTYAGAASDFEYYTTVSLKNMATYCNDLYSRYSSYKDDDRIDNRMKECINFDTFYDNLVKANVINDLSSGCGFMSKDLQTKVVWLLNIIKIAGPILAIALGALDFVKVIASGEADKEMKTAGKRLLRRFIAAILLFIIPIILAWLMDTVLGGENGYETGNPFCETVNWNETK